MHGVSLALRHTQRRVSCKPRTPMQSSVGLACVPETKIGFGPAECAVCAGQG